MAAMKSTTFSSAARAPLDRLLDPLTYRLTPAAARLLVDLRPDSETVKRIAELADKCNEGELTPKERKEYAGYVRGGDLITVLQSKARQFLKTRKR
jgi:hypothetical protein